MHLSFIFFELRYFNQYFDFIEKQKQERIKYLNSKNIKDKCKNLDNYVNKFVYSEYTEGAINFIDSFDVKTAKNILEGAKDFSNLLDSKEKEEFKNNAKELIKTKIYSLYENHLEPELKNLVIDLGKSLVDVVDRKFNEIQKNKN